MCYSIILCQGSRLFGPKFKGIGQSEGGEENMGKTNTRIATVLLSGQGKLLFLLLFVGCIESDRDGGPTTRFNRQVFAKSLILGGEERGKDQGRSTQQSAKPSGTDTAIPTQLAPMGQKKQAKSPEFLFLASTLGTPRKLASQRSNFQGQEKIVQFRLEKNALKVYQMDEDARFEQNFLNWRPIMSIPATHRNAPCVASAKKNCSDRDGATQSENPLDWQQRGYFSLNFNRMTLNHLSELELMLEDPCFRKTSQRVLHVELSSDVVNIEVEREYKLNNRESCLLQHFDFKSFVVANPSFKIRYFYSMVRLSQLATPDYQAVEYPVEEHSTFGFFKDRIERLGDYFDAARPKETYYLNRFAPGKEGPRSVDFHLSASFNKPQNLPFKEATDQAIARINLALDAAHAKLKLNLVYAQSQETEKRSGDLRYNSIVLIDEPLANGLLGYAPSVSHPRTGEILQAHTNMYSGTLKSIVRRTYQDMVRISRRPKPAPAPTTPAPTPAPVIAAALSHPPPSPSAQEMATHQHQVAARMAALQTKQQLSPQSGPESQLSQVGVNNTSLGLNESEQFPQSLEQLLEHHSKNNAYHVEMLNIPELAEQFMPGIFDIPGILTDDKQFKNWEELNPEQKAQVAKIITVNTYAAILVHELGHNLGLRHNFMASTDADNFYSPQEAKQLGMHSPPRHSSAMDYPATDWGELATFGKYDIAALRYAYAREVVLAKSLAVRSIPTTLTALKAELAKEGEGERPRIKPYRFCTDENVGSFPLCSRFDAGTTLTAIATFYQDSYHERYFERNWRNGRLDFNAKQLPWYISSNLRRFRSMRNIYGMFSYYAQFYGAAFMARGCSRYLSAQLPRQCANINDVRDAALVAGNFFLDILKTPDLTCALSLPNDAKNRTVALVRLVDVYHKMGWTMDHVPSTCFDPQIQNYFSNPISRFDTPRKVKGEAGKYLNSISDPNPQAQSAWDIQVRGIWSDKILAMRYLTVRSGVGASSSYRRSGLVDIPVIKEQLDNFFDHIVRGVALNSPIKFQTPSGETYQEEHLQLIGETYQVAKPFYPEVAGFLGLPELGAASLNKALVTNAIWYNGARDLSKGDLAKKFEANLSVLRLQRITPVVIEGQKVATVDIYRYVAEEGNRLARNLIQTKDDFEHLADVTPKLAREVLAARTTVPEEVYSTNIATIVEHFSPGEIEQIVERLAAAQHLPPLEQWPLRLRPFALLGAENWSSLLAIVQEVNTAPADASPQIKAAYEVAQSVLRAFISGDLERQAKGIAQGLRLLYNY